MTDSKQELKPCPVCGGLPQVTEHFKLKGYFGLVHKCAAWGAISFDFSPMETIVERWNARPADPITGEMVEALENLSAAADHHTAAADIAYNAVMGHSRSADDCIDEENRSRKDFEIAQCQARAALARWKDRKNG